MRLSALLMSGVLCMGSSPPIVQATPQGATFRAGTQLVTIDVSVRRQNAPVVGLTASDFELLDNGVPQSIESQSVDSVPVDVTLLVSVHTSRVLGSRMSSDMSRIARLLRPTDRLGLISYARDLRQVVPLQSPNRWPSGILDAIWRREDGVDPRHDPKMRGSSLFDAVFLALARPPELGRRSLVVPFCEGGDARSTLADGRFLEALAARTDALLHVAFMTGRTPGLPSDSTPAQYVRHTLKAAAEATGGALTDVSLGLGSFNMIFDNFRQSYVLQYTVKGVPPGGWHTISVRTPKFPQYTVQHRKGYMGR